MAKKSYSVVLTIGHNGKGIPYGGHGELRGDGAANYGFKDLKGNPHLLAQVPELDDDPALFDLVETISQPENGLVSVGCAGWSFSEDKGYRWSGYVEFAINTAEAIADARNYFPLFFKFDQMLHGSSFTEVVNYRWELEGAHFSSADVDGFTCTVWVYTPHLPSAEEAKEAWQRALHPLIHFLGGYPLQEGRPLFTSGD
ncbi:hypothetical protein [Sphingomonas sp. Root241]|uniref:hypothetical protein n=1 Tax=Sphingomonas sp. Root241 TaxID=1736501 RepID=UPI0006F2A44A|nr:hypothetical protein [Sphingomonas sp. Root241]KRC82073.1 hypothetical protein ASE13_06990 [Sphingomonas sp. Root241]